jgi:hypothetical protein
VSGNGHGSVTGFSKAHAALSFSTGGLTTALARVHKVVN